MKKIVSVMLVAAAMVTGCAASTPASTTASGASASSGGEATMVQLDVRNASSSEICYLYISPVSDTHWGPDLLGSRTLSPGETDHYEMTVGNWDFKAEDCSHHELFQMRNQTVAANTTLTLDD